MSKVGVEKLCRLVIGRGVGRVLESRWMLA